MSNNRPRTIKNQVIAIAILSCILVAVLATSSTPTPESETPTLKLVSYQSTAQRAGGSADTDASNEEFDYQLPPLSGIDLDVLDKTDLFAFAPPKPQAAEASPVEPKSEALQDPSPKIKIHAVYGSFGGVKQSALIGDRIVASGDEIVPGIKVKQVTAEKVHLDHQ
ncbi:hypothetical protein LOC67_13125 [Stieleria sp. JC731]|uniref:hypothetical protein n=1 Tax=Pirellulaceae TaxID=2691357 RepID=UPI001E64EE00|nr:hypothetical protein [Stieleria sp. JC731]MCC9601492.1 hypothetical protein [Stieleria sp. JC731]